MNKILGTTALALLMVVGNGASVGLYAQDEKRDAAEKAGDATENALETAGDGTEKGLDATGKGIGFVVEKTTRGAVTAGKAIVEVFDDDVNTESIDADDARKLQRALAKEGYYSGPIDGVVGPKTRSGLREFQGDEKLPVTGRVDAATLAHLDVN